jgi:hypothetical protein
VAAVAACRFFADHDLPPVGFLRLVDIQTSVVLEAIGQHVRQLDDA